jgi:hypothetical protein
MEMTNDVEADEFIDALSDEVLDRKEASFFSTSCFSTSEPERSALPAKDR